METTLGNLKVTKKVNYNPFSGAPVIIAVPTTEAQKEMWATMKMVPEGTLCYNEVIQINFQGDLDRQCLDSAFQEIIKRHDALRSVFSSDGKTFIIKEFSPISIHYKDLEYNLNRNEVLKSLKEEQVTKKFDLINGPCIRGTLVKMIPGHFTFLLSTHHIVCDGWSFAVILKEMGEIYSALKEGRGSSLPKPFQFTEYAISEAKNGLNQEHKEFWKKRFAQLPQKISLPLDFKRPSFRTYNSERIDKTVPTETVKKLKKVGAASGVSFYTVLMSCYQILLHRLTGNNELVVGMASAAQSDSGKSDLVGHLVNLLPLRNEIDPQFKVIDFFKELRTSMLDSFDHQHFSYGALLKELQIKRTPSEIPLLNTVFNIDQQSLGQGLSFSGLQSSYGTVSRKYENFELFINAVSCEDKLTLECQFNSNIFKKTTITNWFDHFISIMNMICDNPQIRIADLSLDHLYLPKTPDISQKPLKEKLSSNPEVENVIKQIWEKVLNLDEVGHHENFFTLGGHSLLAVEVASMMQEEFSQDFSIKDVFETPTIQELATKVKASESKNGSTTTLFPKTNKSSGPITNSQMQVWYLEEMHPGTTMHNLPASIRLKCKINPVMMERTLHYLIQRQEALRTCITVENGAPVQKVLSGDLPRFKPKLDVVKADEKEILNILNNESQYAFDKEEPPLFKAKLYQLGEEDFVFYFMVHHAIWDGWCFDIFFKELDIIYSALVRGEEPQFEKNPSVSYIDYAYWLHDSLETGKLKPQLDYWLTKLKGPLPILELPNDFKRPFEASHEGATLPFQLNVRQTEIIRAYAKEQGTSVFNVMLTAFKVTLARYSGLDDVIVGSPVRGRTHQDLLQTIGYFVNTVALRSFINLESSFEDNLKRVTQNCMEAFANQQIPFQVVLNQVDHTRDVSRTPIFQTFFSFQDVSNRLARINEVPYSQINIDKASTHTDLDLWVKANDQKIEGAFEYRKDLFKEVTISRFCECFLQTITDLFKNSNKKLSGFSGLPQEHEQLILNDWNKTTVEHHFLPAHKIFEKNVRMHPTKLALENINGALTYEELNRKANQCAEGLMKLGVSKGDLVGLSLSRDLNLIVAMLGILKTGAGYIPLDPSFPQGRLEYMINSARPRIILTENKQKERFSGLTATALIENFLNEEDGLKNPEVPYSLEDIMYVIYTSGSTGDPKGVRIPHLAAANFLNSMVKRPGITSDDKVLAVTTVCFDIHVLEIFMPLIHGASLFLASSFDVVDGVALKRIMDNRSITLMQATPSTWRLLLSAGWKGDKNLKILCGAESFPVDLAKKLLAMSKSVWNMYGPTETTVWSTIKELSEKDYFITIGNPIDNTYVYVLDAHKNNVPLGAPGELFIGGLGLAEGYHGREDLTHEKFIPNPFRPGERMYATGDFARFTHEGELHCLGRRDGQVKVRGYRIELGEIEVALNRVENVKEAAAITHEVKPGDVRIIAFIVQKEERALDEKVFREELGIKLPKYMIPSHFVVIPEMPKTLSGKVEKKSLPAYFEENKSSSETATNKEAVTDEKLMEEMRGIWKEILRKDFKDEDNFFNIGGNSLLAVQLFSKIAHKYGLNLQLATLLHTPEFKKFTAAVGNKLSPSQTTSSVTITENAKHLSDLPTAFTSLVAIKASGTKRPLFCFHGVGGNVLNYVTLAPFVEEDRPLLAMQSRGFDGVTPLSDSIESMAREYIKEMKLVQSQGPYLLAGGSFGGMVAFEVARQLKAEGQPIDKLIMFDTFGPDINIKSYDKSERSFWKNFKISFFYRKKSFLNKLRMFILKSLGLPVPLEIRLFDMEMNNYKALWKYKPQKYRGDLYLIRAKLKDSGWYSDPLMGWGNTIEGEIKTYEIEGKHSEFIESPELGKVLPGVLQA